MNKLTKVIAIQRESNVAYGVPSLSVTNRITEMLGYLESKNKIEFTVVNENEITSQQFIRWADIVILNKHTTEQALKIVEYAKKLKKLIMYDFDDWIFNFPNYSGGNKLNNKTNLIKEIVANCDIVTSSNVELKKHLKEIIGETHLLSNGMWVEKYESNIKSRKKEESKKIVITNADYLKLEKSKEPFLTALQIFSVKNPEIIIDFYGDPFPELVSLPFIHFTNRTDYVKYIHLLINNDYLFSIIPLAIGEDKGEMEEFNKCKNPFKYLNYGLARIPGIYSSSYIYKNIIDDKSNGILVNNSKEEWLDSFEEMLSNNLLRQKMASTAFDDITSNYNISKSASQFSKLLL